MSTNEWKISLEVFRKISENWPLKEFWATAFKNVVPLGGNHIFRIEQAFFSSVSFMNLLVLHCSPGRRIEGLAGWWQWNGEDEPLGKLKAHRIRAVLTLQSTVSRRLLLPLTLTQPAVTLLRFSVPWAAWLIKAWNLQQGWGDLMSWSGHTLATLSIGERVLLQDLISRSSHITKVVWW